MLQCNVLVAISWQFAQGNLQLYMCNANLLSIKFTSMFELLDVPISLLQDLVHIFLITTKGLVHITKLALLHCSLIFMDQNYIKQFTLK